MHIRSIIKLTFSLLLSSLALLTGHAAVANNTTTSASTISDPSQIIQVSHANPKFTITLASNKTTGYSWQLINYNSHLISLVNHVYVAPSPAMPGKGGQEVWTFQVQNIGFGSPQTSKITLLYAQPWNKQKNTKQAVFTIAITE